MKKDKNWMLITYYCPTHGNLGRMETIDIHRKEISKTYLRKHNMRKDLKID